MFYTLFHIPTLHYAAFTVALLFAVHLANQTLGRFGIYLEITALVLIYPLYKRIAIRYAFVALIIIGFFADALGGAPLGSYSTALCVAYCCGHTLWNGLALYTPWHQYWVAQLLQLIVVAILYRAFFESTLFWVYGLNALFSQCVFMIGVPVMLHWGKYFYAKSR